jgi:ribosome-binding factor A
MVSQSRAQKISQRIQRELSQLLLFEITDPALSGVFVTQVKVDKELAYANIFISALEGISRKDEILEGLKRAKGFIRFQLANRINTRSFPRLRFYWDPTPEEGDRIDKLLASIREEKKDKES